MKKITSLLLTASMVAVLTGCSVPGLGSNNSSSSDIPSYLTNSADNSTNSRDSDSTDSRETDSKDTDATDSNASADSKDSADSETYTEPEVGYPDEYGDAMGGLGDTMHTAFFEYTVNSAYLCEQYEGYEPAEGKVLLVADVTVHNPYKSSVPMYDTDFQVQWDSDEDDAYDYPITFYLEEGEVISEDMLPTEYELRRFESRDGLLVYEVPEGENYFSISYLEIYEDNTEGDVFFVYFNADLQ